MTNLETELANWAEQKAQCIEAGDRLDAIREVDHFAAFKSKKEAESAAKVLVTLMATMTASVLRWRTRTHFCALG